MIFMRFLLRASIENILLHLDRLSVIQSHRVHITEVPLNVPKYGASKHLRMYDKIIMYIVDYLQVKTMGK